MEICRWHVDVKSLDDRIIQLSGCTTGYLTAGAKGPFPKKCSLVILIVYKTMVAKVIGEHKSVSKLDIVSETDLTFSIFFSSSDRMEKTFFKVINKLKFLSRLNIYLETGP